MKYTKLILDYLKAHGETWDTFTKRAHVSRSTFYKILKKGNVPRLTTFEKIMDAIGYSVIVRPKPTSTSTDNAGTETDRRAGSDAMPLPASDTSSGCTSASKSCPTG